MVGGVIAIVRARALELGISGSGGHYIATGGLISGTVAFVRAGKSYRAMVDKGGTPWSTPAKAFVIGAAGLAALLGRRRGRAGRARVVAAPARSRGRRVVLDRRDRGRRAPGAPGAVHDRARVRRHARDAGQCGVGLPAQTDSVLNLADGTGFYLCLALDPSLG